MRRLFSSLVLFGTVLLPTMGCAQSVADVQWAALSKLHAGRHGTLLLVDPVHDPQGSMVEEQCRLVSVTPASLTCVTSAGGRKLVFARNDIEAVSRVTSARIRPLPVIVGGVAGGVLGGAVGDGKIDYPLAVLGALGGAALGGSISLHGRSQPVLLYRREVTLTS